MTTALKMMMQAGGAPAPSQTYVDDLFDFQLYSGNGSSVTITTGVDIENNAALVLQKSRFSTSATALARMDPGGGVGPADGLLNPATTAAGAATVDYITGRSTTEYTLGNAAVANSNNTFYTSTVFRKHPKFFNTFSFSHTNGSASTFAHGLEVDPGMVWVKRTDATGEWFVWHTSLTAGNNMRLSTTAQSTSSAFISVSGSNITFASGAATGTYLVCVWADDQGAGSMIKCGTYSGNGSANGVKVTLGFEPQYLLVKNRGTTGNWMIFNEASGMPSIGNQVVSLLNTTAAETVSTRYYRFLADGFQPDATTSVTNANSNVYIYMAIARPNKPPTSGSKVFSPTVYTGTNTSNRLLDLGMKADMAWLRLRAGSGIGNDGFLVGQRHRGQYFLKTASSGPVETLVANGLDQQLVSSERGTAFSSNVGIYIGNDAGTTSVDANINANTASNGHVAYAFRRAPQFYEAVLYTGTGSAKTEKHNLGAVPEMMIVKRHDALDNWIVWHKAMTSIDYSMALDSAGAMYGPSTNEFASTMPTASIFTVGTASSTNGSGGTFTAHLFATRPGVSMVGSYVGNGSSQDIDCGFSAGARFALIKSLSGGQWYVFDSARGMTTGSNPALTTSSFAAEISADVLDAYSGGFRVKTLGDPAINANGITYIFWAIA
jgi:hypothetical protein